MIIISISNKLKTFICRRLETESNFAEIAFRFPPIGAGTDKYISAAKLYLSVPNAKETPPGGRGN